MKTVKIIAALLAALLLTGCSVKLTVGTQDENQPAETAKQVVTVEDIGALVSELQNGHVWMACAESELYSLRIDGSGLTITAYEKQEGSTEKQTLSGTFAADADGVHITDGNGNTVLELTWQLIAEEGENALQRLEMITKTEGGILPKDVTLEFYSTQATDEAGEEEMAAAYLENLQTPDPAKDDLTTLLAGYSGDSIVDACVMHGIDPSLKNRATYAEAFGIEDYKGTSQQNLTLLEKMGADVVIGQD